MAFIGWIFSSLLSLWPTLAVITILILSTVWLIKRSTETKTEDAWMIGLPEIKPGPVWGNDDPSEGGFWIQYDTVYKAMKGLRYCLYYNGGTWIGGNKRLMILDPDLVAKIMITDFDHFVDNTFFSDKYMKAMGNVFGIADAQGDKWRRLRKAVNGPFSIPKMKKYIDCFVKVNKEMAEFVKEEAVKDEKVEAKEFIRKSVMNTLSTVGFSVDANAFKDKDSEMVKMGNALSEMWRWIVITMLPSIAALFRVNCYNQVAEKWFTSLMRKLIGSRKNQETENKDILSTLLKIHEEDPNELDQTAMEKTMLQFIFDGYNTTSDACTGVLTFIATHPEVLEKLREEIDAVFDAKEDGDIDVTDTDVMGMNYLDCVISEQQRLVAVSATSRRVTKPWTIPGTDLTIPVGVGIYLPIVSFHKDPEYWENPLEFNPERFNAENKSKIKTGTYAPFGLGPRKCLGSNYAILTIKFILIYLIRFFDVENCEKLPKKFELDPNSMGLPKGGLRVKFHKREF